MGERVWHQRGWDNKRAETGDEKRREIRRWWLRVGERGRYVHLDDVPFSMLEHRVVIGDSWNNHFTCLENFDQDCAFCDADLERYYINFLTIGSLREWKSERTGKKGCFTKELFGMKKNAWAAIKAMREKRGDLTGWIVEAIRTGKKSERVGSQFDFEQQVNVLDHFGTDKYVGWLKDLERPMSPAEYLTSFDYERVFKPVDPETARRIAQRAKGGGGGGWGGEETGRDDEGGPPGSDAPPPTDDDIPF